MANVKAENQWWNCNDNTCNADISKDFMKSDDSEYLLFYGEHNSR